VSGRVFFEQVIRDNLDIGRVALTVMMRWRVLNGLWLWRMSSSVAAMYS